MWLKEEGSGSRAFFPDGENKRFVFNDDVGYAITRLNVEGVAVMTASDVRQATEGSRITTSSLPSFSGSSASLAASGDLDFYWA